MRITIPRPVRQLKFWKADADTLDIIETEVRDRKTLDKILFLLRGDFEDIPFGADPRARSYVMHFYGGKENPATLEIVQGYDILIFQGCSLFIGSDELWKTLDDLSSKKGRKVDKFEIHAPRLEPTAS